MRIVVAPDKFKGTATAGEMATAVAAALVDAGHDASPLPMADGGEGFLDALGGPTRTSTVTGPDGAAVEARWRLVRGVAVIEMAEAAGLVLAGGPEANDPVEATTAGVGELIALAVESGARRVIIGAGGSATTDGGLGALRAMHPTARFRGVDIEVACDVRTRFVDAAEGFAPQTGATPAVDGAGAAGGLAGGLMTVGAHLTGGFDLVADELRLDESIADADLVITGEGFLDDESFEGKVVGGVAALCADAGVPCLAIVGEVVDPLPPLPDGLAVVSLTAQFGQERALADPVGCAVELALEHVEH